MPNLAALLITIERVIMDDKKDDKVKSSRERGIEATAEWLEHSQEKPLKYYGWLAFLASIPVWKAANSELE